MCLKENYSNGILILYSLDNFSHILGIHTIIIYAFSSNGRAFNSTIVFTVYSDSVPYLVVHQIADYEFMSTGNVINYTTFSDYPDYMVFSIDGNVKYNGTYENNQTFCFLIDGYGVGMHLIIIMIRSLDGKVVEFYHNFTVYSAGELMITIIQLNDDNLNSSEYKLIFDIIARYPGYYKIFINDLLVSADNFTQSLRIIFLLANYSAGIYNITIWASCLDGKQAVVHDSFTINSIKETSNSIPMATLNSAFTVGITIIILPGVILVFSSTYKKKLHGRK